MKVTWLEGTPEEIYRYAQLHKEEGTLIVDESFVKQPGRSPTKDVYLPKPMYLELMEIYHKFARRRFMAEHINSNYLHELVKRGYLTEYVPGLFQLSEDGLKFAEWSESRAKGE